MSQELPHRDSGGECLVGHYDDNGNDLPQCIRCADCFKWVRPERMAEPCPARAAQPPEGT